MIKTIFLFLHTLFAWSITITIFTLHYIMASCVTFFMKKNKEVFFYWSAIPFLRTAFFFGRIKVKVEGIENVDSDKNYIIICNHQSLFDIVVLLAYLPCRVVFFAKRELQKVPILSREIEKMGHEYVDRGKSIKAIKQLDKMEAKIKKGYNVLIFPEGTRSENDEIQPFKRGTFYLAVKSNTSILPCYLHNTSKILPKNSNLFSPGKVTLKIGSIIQVEKCEKNDEKEYSKQLMNSAFNAIKDLQKTIK